MKDAIMMYASAAQTEKRELKGLLIKCEPFGLAVERHPERGLAYRIIKDNQPLTEFTTIYKLTLWLAGYKAGINQQK